MIRLKICDKHNDKGSDNNIPETILTASDDNSNDNNAIDDRSRDK